jgi:hypothetical protein
VARSRHKNCGERHRGATPCGMLIQPDPLEKRFRGGVGGWPTRLAAAAAALGERPHGHEGGRADRPPRGPIRGEPTGGHQAVDGRMVDAGSRPGVQDTPDPDETTDVMRVRGERDARGRRGAAPAVVQVLLGGADTRPQRLGPGEDDRHGGDRPAWSTSCACPPGAHGHRCPPTAAGRPWTRASMARRWRGRRACPHRSRDSPPARRPTSAPAGLGVLQRGQRAAMRAVIGACTTSQVGGVSGVERAVGRGRRWPRRAGMPRRDPPVPTEGSRRRAAGEGWRPRGAAPAGAPPR